MLDNVSTTLSAKSSFTSQQSLLFFTTGLDPNVNHTLQVINEDGSDLSLNVGGIVVFSAGSAICVTSLYARCSFSLKQVVAPCM
jgi:hypothetical protein